MAKTHIGNWIVELDDDTGGLRVERFGKPGRVNIEAMPNHLQVEVVERGGGKRGHWQLSVRYEDVTPATVSRGAYKRTKEDAALTAEELTLWSLQRVK